MVLRGGPGGQAGSGSRICRNVSFGDDVCASTDSDSAKHSLIGASTSVTSSMCGTQARYGHRPNSAMIGGSAGETCGPTAHTPAEPAIMARANRAGTASGGRPS
jgi:hypothetical protein